jgi:sec-independent protein translocase protein TatC
MGIGGAGAIRAFLQPYSGLVTVLKRAGLILAVAFVAFTVLPDSPGPFLTPPNAFLGWIVDSFSVTVLLAMEHSLLPHATTLIVIGPFDAFSVVMEMGFYLSLMVTLPYLVWGLIGWLSPGLSHRERRTVRRLIAFATGLFFAGVAFTYLIILPPIYAFSYSLQAPLGASGTISLEAFVETTFMFMIGIGLSFEIPPVCLGLSYVGILSSKMMSQYWNYAGAACFIIAFMISPGVGGGVIESLIAFFLWGLYGLSFILVRRLERNKRMGAVAVGG